MVIPFLRRRAEAVHAEGAKVFGQVYHPGAAPHAQRLDVPLSPSGVVDPYDALTSHVLTDEEIEELVVAFAHGIRRVQEAGFDAAEIHGAHGYLVTQFLSPHTNRREDAWGGDCARRTRFVLEVVAAARALVGPDFPIGIRVGVDAVGSDAGLTTEELAATCALIAPSMAFVSVSGGSYIGLGDGPQLAYVSPWYREPAHNADAARAVKAVCDVPVFVTGRIADAALAESILADGVADMVGMVRALIADPDLPRKLEAGHPERVRMCLGMSECHHIGEHRAPVTCAVNAAAGREVEMRITRVRQARTVIVVGAGPAGMEAARVSAERGHAVYLADRERSIGGTPRLLATDPNRRNLADLVAFQEPELRRLGVQFVLGHDVAADDIAEFGADVVVVATGGVPVRPEVAGGEAAIPVLDVLRGVTPATGAVVVVAGNDSHLAAGTSAELLADRGYRVEVVSEQMDFAVGVEQGTRLPLLQRLRTKGVRLSQMHRLAAVGDGVVTVVDTIRREERTVDDATAVLACGLTADDSLASALRGRVPVVVVGDALAPRRIMHATIDGARAAMAIR